MEALVPNVRDADRPVRARALAPTLGMALAMALTAAIGVASVMSNAGALETTRWVDHTHRVLQLASDVGAAVADAEAQRRAHALTGDPDRQGAFERAVARAQALMAGLRLDTRDNPGQQRRLIQLEVPLAMHLSLMRAAMQEGSAGAGGPRVGDLTRRGVRFGEAVRAALDGFEAEERRLLAIRIADEDRRVTANRLTTIASAVAALILVGLAFALVRREIARRSRVVELLRSREETLDRTLAAIPDAIVIVDAGGGIVLVNDHAAVLFGYPRGELVGQRIEVLVPPHLRDAHVAHRDRYAKAPAARPMGTGNLALVAVRKDGHQLPVDINLSPLRTADGQFTITAVRDVSARVATEGELRRLHGQAEIANRELESFSYSVAHDLRSPLRSIDGFSQALLEDCGPALGPEGQAHLHRVRAAAQRMARLIDDLLGLSRVTRSEVQRAPVDLSALASEVIERLREAEPGREVEVAVEAGIGVRGDARLLSIVLENLLGNAWKFTATCDRARIELATSRDGGELVVHVRDNGVGFDMAYVGKLFGVFQRLHSQTEFEGTGVGLATVQRIIQRHGGRIWAEGEVGRGATFHFVIP